MKVESEKLSIGKNVPKLRFGGFGGYWSTRKVKEICPLQRGFDLPSTQIVAGEYPVVYSNGIGRFHAEYKVKAPGIVTGRSGTIGNLTFVEHDYWPHNTSLWVTNFFDNDVKYIFYLLNKLDLKRFSTGSGVPTLNRNDVHDHEATIPALPEQQKIASFLSKVDEKIALLGEKKAKLVEYKKGVMQGLFSGEWKVESGKLTFVPPTLRFKADDGSDFPDWEEKKLSSLADLTSSKRVYLADYSEDGIPFFRGKEISDIRKGIIPTDVLYITRKAFEEFKSKYGAPIEGDILVTAVGTLANILRVTGEFEFYFKDGNLIWLRKLKCDSKFLSILMEANKHELLKTAIGSSQKALTIVELKKIVFKIPSLEEQQKITMFLSSLEKKVRLAESELEKVKEWKKGLLQQMFV